MGNRYYKNVENLRIFLNIIQIKIRYDNSATYVRDE